MHWFESTYWQLLYLVGYVLIGAISAGHAIMFKRDPRSAVIWVFMSFVFPFAGPFLYWAVGVNRVERRATKRTGWARQKIALPGHAAQHREEALIDQAVGDLKSLRTVANRVTRVPLLYGNSIEPVHNGEQAYPQMLSAIEQATSSITLESYIFEWDETGRKFARALADAADRGVRVHVLLDALGAQGVFSRMGRMLKKTKAVTAAFFPLRFPFGRMRVNLRNHRKIMVVDGKIGFAGGMNISSLHMVSSQHPDRVEDIHFRITGPIVAEMQKAFAEDWLSATDQELADDLYFPELKRTGSSVCRGISSGPDENFEMILWILQAAFASARKRVRIVTPYFVPSSALISAMVLASLRGVEITMLLPSLVDLRWLKWVTDAYLWQLLERGIKVYRQPPPFVHSKAMIVDDRWVLLGSANLDRRSFRLNFEFNVEAYDEHLAATLNDWYDGMLERAKPVTLEEMDSRPAWKRLRDGAFKTFSPHL